MSIPIKFYCGEGDAHIDGAVIDQLLNESPRAAALVAAAIVERRLEDCLKSVMADKPILLSHLFRPSGPLGSLSVKIDLAHLLGLISESAHKDLLIIKDIRNAFAHKLFVDSFENQSVKDRCKNLMIPDLCYGEEGAELDGPFRVQFTGATAALRDPRARYVLATTAIADQLGVGSTQTDLPKPYV